MTQLISILASAGISALLTSIGVYVSITNRISIIETKIDTLKEQVEKHNKIVERTFVLEAKVEHLEELMK